MRLSAADKRGEIKVTVRDTGRGIPPKDLKNIFEPFYSTKGFGKGTGLGLAIVKRVVDEHRGTLTVESTPGEGTCFTIIFPTEVTTPEDVPETIHWAIMGKLKKRKNHRGFHVQTKGQTG